MQRGRGKEGEKGLVNGQRRREGGREREAGVCRGGTRGALLHKIVKPTVAAPRRDSCKQRQVNLKMQIPPRGFPARPMRDG